MIVLLAHGSPDPRHGIGVNRLAGAVEAALDMPVRVAYLAHQGPTLVQAGAEIDEYPSEGSRPTVRQVDVLPLLLSAGEHYRRDLPELLHDAARTRPDLAWRELPLLPPAELASAVVAAAGAAEAGPPPRSSPIGVVGVAAGSTRPGALDRFEYLARLLRPAGVELVIANGPSQVGSAAELLTSLGARAPVVLPLMFADGFLAQASRRAAEVVGLRSSPPVGERPECTSAMAGWVAAHVSHATHFEAPGIATTVGGAPW
ncbi:MAG: hypothetical protein KDC23_03880 [Actinobacteria bacterium]|nr:hypothetical protein [Actinomycetota bacterium]